MNPVLCIHVPDSSLYIICVFFLFQSNKNSGCYGFHRLIIGKVEISYFFWTNCRYLNFVFAEIFIEYISMFQVTFFLILYFDWLLGPHKEKHLKIFSSEIVYGMKPVLCIHVPDSSL